MNEMEVHVDRAMWMGLDQRPKCTVGMVTKTYQSISKFTSVLNKRLLLGIRLSIICPKV